jgi:arsenate reductase
MTLTPTLTMYGIKTCDTVAKARRWLDDHGKSYDFHDYKALGVTQAKLEEWAGQVGWEVLLNKAGTTFRKLPEADRQDIDQARAIALMIAQPSMIKRPVLEGAGPLIVGFKPERYEAAL